MIETINEILKTNLYILMYIYYFFFRRIYDKGTYNITNFVKTKKITIPTNQIAR